MSSWNPLRRFFRKSPSKTPRRASAPSSRAFQIEALESRTVLNYDVSFAANLFVVQASVGDANSIEVQLEGANYQLEDVSAVPQVFNLQQSAIDEGWSTTNGGTVLIIPVTSVAGRTVDVNLGDENDDVSIGDAIADDFNLNGQSDDDTFTFTNSGSIGGDVNGGSGDDLIVGDDNGNTFTINAIYGGLLTDKILGSFSSVESLTGGAGVDTFTFTNSGSLAGAINGGGGTTDRIIGDDDGSEFLISAANGGSITDKVVAFTGIEGLTGGIGDDTFTFTNAGTLGSSLVGGGGDDTLVGDDDGNTFTVFGVGLGSMGAKTGDWSEIENLTGGIGDDVFTFVNTGSIAGNVDGGDANDSLTGDSDGNAFTVDGANAGTLPGKIGGTFTNVENLNGGAGADTFLVAATGTLSGNVSGSGGSDTFTFDNTESVAGNANGGAGDDTFNINVASAVTGDVNGDAGLDTFQFSNLGTIVGNVNGGTDTDTIIGDDDGNSFQITSNSGGVLDGKMTAFSNVEKLTGGADDDTFTFTNTGALTATDALLDGAGGNDSITGDDSNAFIISDVNKGTITGKLTAFANVENLTGGTLADTFTFTNTDDLVGSLTGNVVGAGGSDTITGNNNGNTFNIFGDNAGTLTDLIGGAFASVENLNGGTGDDTFIFSVVGVVDGNVAGGAGDDVFTFDSPLAVGGNVGGDAGNDTFTFGNLGSIEGGVVGGADVDTLIGDDDGNAFQITVSGGGILEGKMSAFTTIEKLSGGAGDDTFTFINAGSLAAVDSLVDGLGGNDTIVGDDSNSFVIDTVNGGSISGKLTAFANIENLTGGIGGDTFAFNSGGSLAGAVKGGTGNDTVFGDDDGNTFTVTGENAGRLEGKMSGFTEIETLSGGASVDSFVFTNEGSISGALNGQGGSDYIFGDNDGNNFSLLVANGGFLEDKIGGAFTNIENLMGGPGNDNFAFAGDGSVDGDIDGGGDSLDFDSQAQFNNLGDVVDYSNLAQAVTVTFGRPDGSASRIGGTFRAVESILGSPGNDFINKFYVGAAVAGFAKGSFIDGNGGVDRIDSLNNVRDVLFIQDSVNNGQKPLLRPNTPSVGVFPGIVDAIVPLRTPGGASSFRLLSLARPRPSTPLGVNQFLVLTRAGFMNVFNSFDIYRATVRMLFSEALGVDRALFATNATFQQFESLWAFDRGYGMQTTSAQLIHTFLRGAIAPVTGQDFFLNFFQRFDRGFTPSDSAVLALMARRNPQSLGQIVRGLTSFRSIYPSNFQAAASWVRQSITEPALAAGIFVNPAEVSRLQQHVARVLGGGNMLSAIEQIFNSALFIRTAVAIAQTDADANTFSF